MRRVELTRRVSAPLSRQQEAHRPSFACKRCVALLDRPAHSSHGVPADPLLLQPSTPPPTLTTSFQPARSSVTPSARAPSRPAPRRPPTLASLVFACAHPPSPPPQPRPLRNPTLPPPPTLSTVQVPLAPSTPLCRLRPPSTAPLLLVLALVDRDAASPSSCSRSMVVLWASLWRVMWRMMLRSKTRRRKRARRSGI